MPSTHSYAGRTDLTVDDLHGLADADGSNGSDELDLLLLDDGHCLRDQVLDLCRSASLATEPASSVTRAASLSTIVQCVVGGLGCTLVPMSAVPAECDRPTGRVGCRWAQSAGRTVSLAYRTSSHRGEDFSVLADAVKTAYQESLEDGQRVFDRAARAD